MKARLVWLVLCGIWGSTWLFIKLGLTDLPPLTFAGIRFVIASIILCSLIAIRGVPLPRTRRDLLLLAVTGVLLGVIGVGVVLSNQLQVSGPKALWGSAALVLSAFCTAYANVLVKAYGLNLQPSVLAAGQMIFGLIPLLLVGVSTEGNPLNLHWTPRAILAMGYLAVVGSVIAFLLYYWLVQHMQVTKSMLIALVTPVVAVVLGMLVLDERLTWRTLAGGAMIICGIGLIVVRRRRRRELEGDFVTAA